MERLFDSVGIKLKLVRSGDERDDDHVDRLHHQATPIILIVFAIVVSSKQFVGEPIDCWVPAHFSSSQLKYTNDYCWIQNTYFLPNDMHVPSHDNRVNLPYYQWVSIILLVEALMFYVPYLLWTLINIHSGIVVRDLVASGHSLMVTEMAELRDRTLFQMTKQMDRFLSFRGSCEGKKMTLSLKTLFVHNNCCRRVTTNSISILYIIIKIVYLLNVIAQPFLLDRLLGCDFHGYGVEFLVSAVNGNRDWSVMTSRFPRTAMCDLKVRRLGDVHRYSVECVLPINLFNEKIFLVLWFWFIFLAVITSVSLLKWLWRIVYKPSDRKYVKNHLRFLRNDVNTKNSQKFVDDYLKKDGVFVLRIIGGNTNTVTVTEFMGELWKNFKEKRKGDMMKL